jgi:hypothetical protein
MNQFLRGIFYELAGRVTKMEEGLNSPRISKSIDKDFFQTTLDLLKRLHTEIKLLIASGDLDIDELSANNIIKYNTYYERLMTIELFRYLIILNYGEAEEYFARKVKRIYDEISCLQKPPLITTISNSENYYWALPVYDIIAVPTGEERNLLNLPDLYHEMGHLIEKQSVAFLKGNIEQSVTSYFQAEMQRVLDEERPAGLIGFFREKLTYWIGSWIMEFTCDLIATFLVGPAYAWTNLKLTTLSSGKDRVFQDSPSHPSDEARMRAIFYLLKKMGYGQELANIESSWNIFLSVTDNAKPQNYVYTFPQELLEQLADNVYQGCINIGLRSYNEQVRELGNPISKILNDAWGVLFSNPEGFSKWEQDRITEIKSVQNNSTGK